MAMNSALRAVLQIVADPESIQNLSNALYQAIKDVVRKAAKDGTVEVADEIAEATGDKSTAGTAQKKGSRAQQEAEIGLKSAAEVIEEHQKAQLQAINQANRVAQMGSSAVQSIMKSALGILEDIYNRLKASSPLLEAIESLFNLAMMLFFMPLGNKIGELLIPAVMDLLDNVIKMWDAFDNMSIGDMIDHMVHYGAEVFSRFFYDIAEVLLEQGGWLAQIGRLMQTIAGFIEHGLVGTVTVILGTVMFIVEHLKEFLALFIAFKVMHTALMIALIAVSGSDTPWGAVAAATAIAGVSSYLVMTGMGMAEGGYVPAKEGGSLRVLGEGGQGEYVIPEDRINNLGGTTNITYNISGVTSQELQTMIKDTINNEISSARLRSAF